MSPGESVSELEKDMLHAFEEQEGLSAANTPNRPHSHRPNPEPACLQVDQEPDQSAPQALGDATPFRTQWQKETNFIPIILGKQPQEKAAGEVREAEDMGGSSEPKQAELAEKRTFEWGQSRSGATLIPRNTELPLKA